MSCKAMFEQVDTAFQKGMVEHTAAAQQQFDATLSPLAHALRVCTSVLANLHFFVGVYTSFLVFWI